MNTEIYLNGIAVSDAVPKILINGVTVEKPEIKTSFADRPFGGRVKNSIYRSFIKITLEAQFRAVGKPILRAECVDRLNAWAAKPGYITLSNRPGKRIYAECVQFASEGTLHKSAEVASVSFESVFSPYWENEQPATALVVLPGGGETAEAEMNLECTYETPVSAAVTVRDTPIQSLTLRVGDTSITLESPETADEEGNTFKEPFADANDTIEIIHDFGVMTITKNGIGIYSLLTPDSSDELIAQPGINIVSVSASAPVTCVFKAHGRWV